MLFRKAVKIESCAACHVNIHVTCHVKRPLNICEHQRVPAARFNNIFLKLFGRHATHCYIQVDLKSFLASRAFFLGREETERATTS